MIRCDKVFASASTYHGEWHYQIATEKKMLEECKYMPKGQGYQINKYPFIVDIFES